MKWKQEDTCKPPRRTRWGFLFIPKTINRVTRWWEFARWEEELYGDGGGMAGGMWWEVKWID